MVGVSVSVVIGEKSIFQILLVYVVLSSGKEYMSAQAAL